MAVAPKTVSMRVVNTRIFCLLSFTAKSIKAPSLAAHPVALALQHFSGSQLRFASCLDELFRVFSNGAENHCSSSRFSTGAAPPTHPPDDCSFEAPCSLRTPVNVDFFCALLNTRKQLVEDMKQIEAGWPEKVLKRQRDWVGRSEGAFIDFAVKDSKQKIRVFTTRIDTVSARRPSCFQPSIAD